MYLMRTFLGVLFVLIIASVAQARITVSATNGGTYIRDVYGGDEYGLTLTATETGATTFTISRTTASDVLRYIDIYSSNPGGTTEIEIAGAGQEFAHIEEINLLDDDGPTIITRLYITGSLGKTEVNQMYNFEIGSHMDEVTLRAFSGGGTFLSGVVSGNVTGDIILEDSGEAPFGAIDILNVSGTIGTPESPIDIRVGNYIGYLKAAEINASIRGNAETGEGSYVGQVFGIETFSINSSSADIRGDIRCRMTEFDEIPTDRFIRARGDLECEIYIGGSFEDKIEYESEIESLQSGGFKGRLIINAWDESGIWTAPVHIGPVTSQTVLEGNDYSPSDTYPNSASSLGGGSIGVVPFNLHRTDCFPAHDSIIHPLAENAEEELLLTNKVCMRHYGPVAWDSGDGEPYEVRRRKAGSSDNWLLQDCFTCEMDEDNDTVVWVKTTSVAQFQRGFEYQVSRRQVGGENVLRCKLPHLTLSTYPEVADFDPLEFQVCEAFPAGALGDADNSGVVDSEDVDCALENWGSTACMKYGDADRNGAVNGEDLIIAEMYVEWTYCDTAPQGFMKVADGFAQMDLDQDSAAMSAPMTVTQAVVAMGYRDIDHFGAAFEAMEAPARAAARAVLMALISGE